MIYASNGYYIKRLNDRKKSNNVNNDFLAASVD